MSKPKILVTGATGKTGSAIAIELVRQGWPVRAVVRSRDERSDRLEALGVETVAADFFDPDQLFDAMRGIQRAYFLPIFDPFMIQGAAAFAWAAKEAKLEQVVQMSQWLASPAHPSLATRQLWLVEQMFAAIPGVAHTIVNPGMFADNFLRLIDFASLLGVYPHLTKDSRSAPVASEDIARVVAAVLAAPERHAGKSYRPTGPKLLSARDIADAMHHVLGKRVLPIAIPFWMFTKTARLQGLDPFEASGYRFYMEDHRRGAFEYGGGVNDTVRELTGAPAEDFETTVRRYAELPFAQRTLGNRMRALWNFNRTPFQPGWNLEKYDRDHRFPVPPMPSLAADDARWKTFHGSSVTAGRPVAALVGSAA